MKGVIDGVEAIGRLACRPPTFGGDHLYVDGAGQPGGNLVLHVKEVGALLVETFGP